MAGAVSAPPSGRNRRRRRYTPMAEINVTPFVDVMLVLLIIFMVSAPLLAVGVPVDLPETGAKPLTGDTEPLTVSVNKEGKVYLMETEVPMAELLPKLTAMAANRRGLDERIFVRGDRAAAYGEVARVMAVLNSAGFKHIALVNLSETGG